MKTKILAIAAVGLLAGPMAAEASLVTHGLLSSDDDTSALIITDSLNHLQWMKWGGPQTGLTYAQTVAALEPGGALDGWHIAGIEEAQLFVEALLYGIANGCDTIGNDVCSMDGLSSTAERVVGESFYDFHSYGYDPEAVFFLSANGTGADVGILELMTYTDPPAGYASKYNEWATISDADWYATSCNECQIGWLLYRPHQVPEPSTLALLGLGLAGLWRRRRTVREIAAK